MATRKYADAKVALVGAGLIGAGWAVHLLYHGQKNLILFDTQEASLTRAKERISQGLQFFVDNGVLTAERKAELEAIPQYTLDIKEACGDAEFIIENAPETLTIKQQVIANIEAVCRDDAIISSSTSGIMVRYIAAKATHKERIIGAHPYLPVYLLPLVEIVIDEDVQDKYLNKLTEFLKEVNKKPVVLKKDCPSYIGSRLMGAILRESMYMIENGVCDMEDIDTAFCYGPGMRYGLMGPFHVYELTGGDAGIRGLFNGPIGNGQDRPQVEGPLSHPNEYGNVYPPAVGLYLREQTGPEMDRILASEGRTHKDLEEYRDKGLLELLKVHGLI